MSRLHLWKACAIGAALLAALPAKAKPAGAAALIENRCLDCHDNATQKGKLSLESTDQNINADNAAVWRRCLEQIERGFMPPAGKKQPTDAERDSAVRDLETRLVQYHTQQAPLAKHAVLRRLNREEYRNTIRDLLHLELSTDPTASFPGDQRSHGFISSGETRVTSSFLLRQYHAAAEDIVDRAVQFGPKPAVQKWQMRPPFDRSSGVEQLQTSGYFKKIKQPQPYQDICQRIGAGGAPYGLYHPLDDLSDSGVPVSGWYRVRIQAEAKFRHSLVQTKFKRWPSLWDESEPIRLSLFTATLQGFDNDARTGLLPRIYLWQLTQLKVICVYAKVAASMFLDLAASTKASACRRNSTVNNSYSGVCRAFQPLNWLSFTSWSALVRMTPKSCNAMPRSTNCECSSLCCMISPVSRSSAATPRRAGTLKAADSTKVRRKVWTEVFMKQFVPEPY